MAHATHEVRSMLVPGQGLFASEAMRRDVNFVPRESRDDRHVVVIAVAEISSPVLRAMQEYDLNSYSDGWNWI